MVAMLSQAAATSGERAILRQLHGRVVGDGQRPQPRQRGDGLLVQIGLAVALLHKGDVGHAGGVPEGAVAAIGEGLGRHRWWDSSW